MQISDVVKKKVSPSEELQAANEHLAALNRELQAQVKAFLKDKGRFTNLVNEAVKAITPVTAYSTWSAPKKGKRTYSIGMVLKVSDWQIGEVIDPKETEGFGVFNYEIAKQRVFDLIDRVNDQANMYRKGGFDLPQLDIFSEADLLSGNIHYELEVTNEWPITIAIARAAELFAEMVRRLSTNFSVIKIWEMSADNHGRLTRKNQAKQGAQNNYSRLAHEFANALLSDLVEKGRVVIEMGEGTKLLADVVGQKFLISHGHEVMGSLGIPYYGLERGRAREAIKRLNTDKTFNYISCGHWHVPAIIAGSILVNGSLPGTTEFDHMQGRHAPPQQVSFLVHPSYGIFGWTAWQLK